MEEQISFGKKISSTLLTIGTVGLLGFLGYQDYTLTQTRKSLEKALVDTNNEFASTTQKLYGDISELGKLLVTLQDEKIISEQDLMRQREILDENNRQIQLLSGTLNVYKKLATTDKELLAKYSKVYFLNDIYTPKLSVTIPPSYTFNTKKEEMISADVWPFLQKMLDDAIVANVDLKIISAFRSFDTQSQLKSAYTVTYGTGSNRFSADQGYSEHQLGTALDFTTSKLGNKFETFEKTASYKWLAENAYKYGFILSYPKNNAYYIFEPWHWRFIGKALAQRLHAENKNFYDLTQREIDTYLISIFDN